ncbi:TPA: hypothetical protein HA238_06175 [Candidatus Micrarchaeota archaeon]|nr:hypothetical protein [Candidatus Micrarchaeota archaeon]
MKIKLTPELSYIIGFWRKRRTKEGIGVYGDSSFCEIFSKEILERGLTTSDKLLANADSVYFYHTAYRKFFQDVEDEQLERFKYLNEYAASYLAGMFDSAGGIDVKGFVYIDRPRKQDEMILIRLGFGARVRDGRLVVEKPRAFLAFVKNYVKVHAGHDAFKYIKTKG